MSNWISSDRLPPVDEQDTNISLEVILYSECNLYYIGYYKFSTYNWYMDNQLIRDNITHWQHLPSRPKKHTQEEINAWDSVE